jgi:HSP20 family molecular chaperone IbpA
MGFSRPGGPRAEPISATQHLDWFLEIPTFALKRRLYRAVSILPVARTGPAKPLEGGLWIMNRTLFNSPFLLGFEHIERLLERTAKADSYPPYNIEHADNDRLKITLAVAGFRGEDLSVSVEDNQLVIRGRVTDPEDKTFLHRGIASRQFQRSFVLAEGIEVLVAELRHGLLTIELERPCQESVVRTIPIRSAEVHDDDATNQT